ncbi:MAG: type II toxin-antitoxin system Phd/YefM family antitoxin [Acetobacteraceae bacterium]|nr:type II toxin-antitoxin system Phd/YefM family antitoxin [Acetobacteraceae bacterium]
MLVHLDFMDVAISIRQFKPDVGAAKRTADRGPVTITDGGRPTQVLLRGQDHQRLYGAVRSLLAALGQKGAGGFAFEPPRMGDDISRPAGLD